MKLQKLVAALLFLGVVLSLTSCLKDSCQSSITYTRLMPVFKSLEEIRAEDISFEPAKPLKNPGAIYYYNNYIFIGEPGEGVHAINNNDPQNPVNEYFIAIPGNESFAIKDGLMYASSYIDLLTIALPSTNLPSTADMPSLIGRTENVFPALWVDEANHQIAVAYEEMTLTEDVECGTYGNFYRTDVGDFFDIGQADKFYGDAEVLANSADDGATGVGNTGVGGSLARF
ncbi:MAG: hypothetical protein IT258_13800, partial [Saprospiraceae bacterium]|nr:hypothetical protein [Saprospiraceae bacterium]